MSRSIIPLPSPLRLLSLLCLLSLLFLETGRAAAQSPGEPGSAYAPPEDPTLSSGMRGLMERYAEDRSALFRRFDARRSPARRQRLEDFYRGWRDRLDAVPYEGLGVEGRVDWHLMAARLEHERVLLEREEGDLSEVSDLIPWAGEIFDLHESRRRMVTITPPALAARLDSLADRVEETRSAVRRGLREGSEEGSEEGPGEETGEQEGRTLRPSKTLAHRAAGITADLRKVLERWFEYYDGYHPEFSWWCRRPYEAADGALEGYLDTLREDVVGTGEGEDGPIVGDPIGREALLADLEAEMIPYTPEELMAIAEEEFAWCETEMLRASRELGFGEDWHAALEHVKRQHADPGKQPYLIRDLAAEAIEFVTSRDLLTLPDLAKEIWRMEMLSPERQKVSPFFLGGEVIQVSFPTDSMEHEEKLMSLRGNNVHFARATVHHELIPGHHLQGFMTARYATHRAPFGTPFWTEGWALYWEMLLWDLGFPRGPEDRVGMLFWRMHRCARILFSLGFHLGELSPQECVDMLVERVGHERANAEAEVRRSFEGSYPPLYQAAYMLGALQVRALREELVEGGRIDEKAFHDAFLQGGRMPIELVRARLQGRRLPKEWTSSWRFYLER
ncbi:MAG: DUF885 family protein [bacterium]